MTLRHPPITFIFILITCFLAAANSLMPASEANRQAPAPGKGAGLASLLNADGTLDPAALTNGSFDVSGYQMKMTATGAPRFVPLSDCESAAGTWANSFRLPNGVNGTVYALAVSGSVIYVGGDFTAAGGAAAASIARFDTTTNTWSALGADGSGALGRVGAIAVSGSDVYIGGAFFLARNGLTTFTANNIARFSALTNTWSTVGSDGSGVNSAIYALQLIGADLYVGGYFRQANVGGTVVAVNYLARFNTTTNQWNVVSSGSLNGIGGEVTALAASGSDLYVGGGFTAAYEGAAFAANGIARYDTLSGQWSRFGSGSGDGVNNYVLTIAITGSDLYVGGYFTQANVGGTPVAAGRVARYDMKAGAWSALGADGNGVSDSVTAVTIAGDDLFIGGTFTQANVGGIPVAGTLFRFNIPAQTWSAVNTNGTELRSYFGGALAVTGGGLYAGGDFARTWVGGTAILANNIARFDLTSNTWSALGAAPGKGVNGQIYAMAVSGNYLYVAGTFSAVGDVIANGIARFNLMTNTWSPLGSDGNGVDGFVLALAVVGDVLYVGGNLYEVNVGGTSVSTSGIARYDLTTNIWSALDPNGSGVSGGEVDALAVNGDDLYVGGLFSHIPVPGPYTNVKNVAKFNTTTDTWSALGANQYEIGVENGFVYAMAVAGNDLYIGGSFISLPSRSASHIVKYNMVDRSWSLIGPAANNGIPTGIVRALAVSGSDLYIGGSIRRVSIGGTVVPVNGIVRYNMPSNSFSIVGAGSGNGVDNLVFALAVSGSNLYVGGYFMTANVGGEAVPANNIARFNTTTNIWSALGSAGGNGVDDTVKALALDGVGLFAGGLFSQANVGGAGGTASSSIGKFVFAQMAPPQITCPSNLTAIAPAACPLATSLAVSYSTPTTDCPGTSVVCTPPSGSAFAVGTTTVTCTATAANGLTATCGFAVAVFALSLQDGSNPASSVLFNPTTGDYRFCCNGVVVASGKGTPTVRACTISIAHSKGERRVLIQADTSTKRGTATLQLPLGDTRCSINDTNMDDNDCHCQ